MLIQGAVVGVLVLICMLGAKQPQRSAMSIVLYVAIVSIGFNAAYLAGWVSVNELSPLIGIFEIFAACVTIAVSIGLRKEDRVFFSIMTKFLITSACINFIAPLGVITDTMYQVTAYMVVVAHLGYMLRNSDGVMDIFGSVRDYLSGTDNSNASIGQRES